MLSTTVVAHHGFSESLLALPHSSGTAAYQRRRRSGPDFAFG